MITTKSSVAKRGSFTHILFTDSDHCDQFCFCLVVLKEWKYVPRHMLGMQVRCTPPKLALPITKTGSAFTASNHTGRNRSFEMPEELKRDSHTPEKPCKPRLVSTWGVQHSRGPRGKDRHAQKWAAVPQLELHSATLCFVTKHFINNELKKRGEREKKKEKG